jgi:ubiquinone/menaquinone biosynthesis C-methylase UbiE
MLPRVVQVAGYFLLNPFRRLRQDPRKLRKPYVREGMTVFDPGPGTGFFTLELLRLVGKSSRVIATDVQRKMPLFCKLLR